VRLLDLPWIVLPDHPAVMVYPRPLDTEQPLDMDRLYALGIDAFRVARELALRDGSPFGIDGVTGRLDVVAGPGGQLQLQRIEAADKFGREVLRVAGRAAVAAGEDLVAIGKRIEHQLNRLRNRLCEKSRRLHLEFGAFLEVGEDALSIHGQRL
jgi:hypothetical protein